MRKWKGIVLAGGFGTRLYPITLAISKQLLPIYNKPMIYYPISVLMLAGIKDILIITTPEDNKNFKKLLGDGSNFGINLQYEIQPSPHGIAQAFIIGKYYIGDCNVCLILGDNIFYGQGFISILRKAIKKENGASVFSYPVKDPERFSVLEFDETSKVISIEEKPKIPKSQFVLTGLYFYDNEVVEIAKYLKPSKRGEYEIANVNQVYLDRGNLKVEMLGRGFSWLDTGTNKSLLAASQFVETVETRQGYQIACLEEIGFKNGWLTRDQVMQIGKKLSNSSYGKYILSLVEKNT